MKYLAIAVLLAIGGRAIHYVNHADEPPPPDNARGGRNTEPFAASLGVTP